MVDIAPFGEWPSPITARHAADAGGGPNTVVAHGDTLWWTESRPAEGGRQVLVRERDGRAEDVLAAPWNVRSRVHEYGGRCWTVLDGDRVVFSEWADQRLYLAVPDAQPVALSPRPALEQGLRYAEPVLSPDGTEVWCVREEATGTARTEVRRALVAVPLSGAAADDPGAVRELVASHHFMNCPRPSPDGARLAWIGWDHPSMPWDGTELCVAEIGEDGTLGQHTVLAGGPAEAVCQVEWDGAGSLLALTDPDGWWNLHRIGLDGTSANLAPCDRDIGGALWKLGSQWFTPLGEGRHVVLRGGRPAILDEASGEITDVPGIGEYTVWSATLAVLDGAVAGVAGGPHRDVAVVRADLDGGGLRTHGSAPEHLAYLPVPEHRTFTDADGNDIPAYVYPPTNPDSAGPGGQLPPYLVHVHGGPTGSFAPVLDLEIAYFTSRGIGVVAVNHGGSTGYGRVFRERLREQWGLVDVRDCATVATALAQEGTADGERLAIRGGSAGGWTSSASLTSVHTYRCGTVMYPIIDLLGWTAEGGEVHDFEAHYLHSLVGPLPATRDRYLNRSPVNRVDQLAGPVLMLQGLDDQICPPEQAEKFMAQLAGTGVPHAYLTFEGEQHGFRRAETIVTALQAELSFYGQVLGFTPPGVPVLELTS